jgi:hypothetical protein
LYHWVFQIVAHEFVCVHFCSNTQAEVKKAQSKEEKPISKDDTSERMFTEEIMAKLKGVVLLVPVSMISSF